MNKITHALELLMKQIRHAPVAVSIQPSKHVVFLAVSLLPAAPPVYPPPLFRGITCNICTVVHYCQAHIGQAMRSVASEGVAEMESRAGKTCQLGLIAAAARRGISPNEMHFSEDDRQDDLLARFLAAYCRPDLPEPQLDHITKPEQNAPSPYLCLVVRVRTSFHFFAKETVDGDRNDEASGEGTGTGAAQG